MTSLIDSADSTLHIEGRRAVATRQEFRLTATLQPDQQAALRDLVAGDTGVLIAPPGSGKTVIACAAIASRAVTTLILADRKALADQWRARVRTHLDFQCGQIGGGRSKTTGIIDIALLPTLARRTNVAELTGGYGQVIVDECHHVAASTFSGVLAHAPAKYWLGLTATPYRRDRLDELIYHQLGMRRHVLEPTAADELPTAAPDAPAPHPVLHVHPTRFRYTGGADPTEPGGIAAIYRALVADEERLQQICADIVAAHRDGANILVLTTWTRHLDALAQRLADAGCPVITLRGGMKARERQQVTDEIAAHRLDQPPLLIVGTGAFIGEGFDCPVLDTLFLAAPISFKARLIQYVGRITRSHPGKTTATVHDYPDELTPILASSLRKRAAGYTHLGFPDPHKQLPDRPGSRRTRNRHFPRNRLEPMRFRVARWPRPSGRRRLLPLSVFARCQRVDEGPQVCGARAHVPLGCRRRGVPEEALHLEGRCAALVQAGGERVSQRVHRDTVAGAQSGLGVDVRGDAGELIAAERIASGGDEYRGVSWAKPSPRELVGVRARSAGAGGGQSAGYRIGAVRGAAEAALVEVGLEGFLQVGGDRNGPVLVSFSSDVQKQPAVTCA